MMTDSMPSHIRFIKEEMVLKGGEKDFSRDVDVVYNLYKGWHKDCGFQQKIKE